MKKFTPFCIFLFFLPILIYGQYDIQTVKLDKIIDLQKQPYDEWGVMLKFEPENFFGNKNIQESSSSQKKQRPRTISKSSTSIELGESFQGAPKRQNVPVADNGTDISKDEKIVHTTNSDFVVKDKEGKVLYENSIAAFFNASAGDMYDPRVIYDNYNDRFIVMAMARFTEVAIAFSQTNDPAGKWNHYLIKAADIVTDPGSKDFFPDYPFIGITENELVVSSVYAWINGDDNTEMDFRFHSLQISKKEGYAGDELKFKNHDNGNGVEDGVIKTHSVTSVDTYLDNGAPKSYLLRMYNDTRDYFTLHEITASIDDNPEIKDYKIPLSESYHAQPDFAVKQKDGEDVSIAADRVHKAIYYNGKIYAVYSTNTDNAGFQGLYYVQIDVEKKTSELFTYTAPNTNFIFPSLALIPLSGDNEKVRAGITFIEVSESKYPSLNAILCDENGDWTKPILAKEGTDNVGYRLGDYTSCFHQGGTNSFWISGEYGDSENHANNWIAEINVKTITGIDDKTTAPAQSKIQLAPNPVIEDVKVSFNIKTKTQGQIVLYNNEGKLIKVLYEGILKDGDSQLFFNTAMLTKGVYFIKVEDGNGSLLTTEKMIKQ